MHAVLFPQEGRFANVTNVGAGCGGREGIRRESATYDVFAYGEGVWS